MQWNGNVVSTLMRWSNNHDHHDHIIVTIINKTTTTIATTRQKQREKGKVATSLTSGRRLYRCSNIKNTPNKAPKTLRLLGDAHVCFRKPYTQWETLNAMGHRAWVGVSVRVGSMPSRHLTRQTSINTKRAMLYVFCGIS